MTTRLYYTDATARVFEATVVSCEVVGARTEVVLDRTAFYPTSGGQPFDTGRLGDARVIEVADGPDGAVVHVTTTPLGPGARVEGHIDWPRRFDHMQQHTGQHVLSAVCAARRAAMTTSFHMGAETSTIDLDRDLAPDAIAEVETEANRLVWEDRPVGVRFVSAEEAEGLALRKAPARTGALRIVEIEGCDLSACGGTHVPSTGMIGMIAVTASERFKGGTRVTFVCGGRALASHAALRDVVLGSTRALSVTQAQLLPGIERVQRDLKALTRTVRDLEDELVGHRAAGLRATVETLGRYRGVLRADAEGDAARLTPLAGAVVAEPGLVAVLVGGGDPAPLVVARSADVDLDAAALVREVVQALGGRGGGRPEGAQAGVPAPAARILEVVHDALRRR